MFPFSVPLCVLLSLPGISLCNGLDPVSLWINFPDLDESSQNVIMRVAGSVNLKWEEKEEVCAKEAKQKEGNTL